MENEAKKIGICATIKAPTGEEPFIKILKETPLEKHLFLHEGKFITYDEMMQLVVKDNLKRK